jgi:hypothetical protein
LSWTSRCGAKIAEYLPKSAKLIVISFFTIIKIRVSSFDGKLVPILQLMQQRGLSKIKKK